MAIWQIRCAYNGAPFKGWNAQPGQTTIQGTLEATYCALFKEAVKITAASRTDKGVHALAQILRWETKASTLPARCIERWQQKLPPAIKLNASTLVEIKGIVPPLRHALQKTYQYIINDKLYSVFNYEHVLFYDSCRYAPLKIKDLETVANCFIGTHDFTLFSRIKANENINPMRTISAINIRRNDKHFLEITFIGPSFIRHQIRFMVGAMLAYCQNKVQLSYLQQQLKNTPHVAHSPFCVPGSGLFLIDIQIDGPG